MEIYRLTNVPETLFYVPNFISENEEKELISSVMNVPKTRWVQLRNRRLQNWGGQPHSNGMIQTELLPKWLEPFTERIVQLDENATIFPQRNFQFNHCLVNEYQPGQGIMAHTDGPVYYPIVTTISLQAPIVIEFYKPIDENEILSMAERCVAKVLLEPRSLFIVKDSMYRSFLHGIEDRFEDSIDRGNISNFDRISLQEQILPRETRISLTIRHVEKVSKFPIGFLKK